MNNHKPFFRRINSLELSCGALKHIANVLSFKLDKDFKFRKLLRAYVYMTIEDQEQCMVFQKKVQELGFFVTFNKY